MVPIWWYPPYMMVYTRQKMCIFIYIKLSIQVRFKIVNIFVLTIICYFFCARDETGFFPSVYTVYIYRLWCFFLLHDFLGRKENDNDKNFEIWVQSALLRCNETANRKKGKNQFTYIFFMLCNTFVHGFTATTFNFTYNNNKNSKKCNRVCSYFFKLAFCNKKNIWNLQKRSSTQSIFSAV